MGFPAAIGLGEPTLDQVGYGEALRRARAGDLQGALEIRGGGHTRYTHVPCLDRQRLVPCLDRQRLGSESRVRAPCFEPRLSPAASSPVRPTRGFRGARFGRGERSETAGRTTSPSAAGLYYSSPHMECGRRDQRRLEAVGRAELGGSHGGPRITCLPRAQDGGREPGRNEVLCCCRSSTTLGQGARGRVVRQRPGRARDKVSGRGYGGDIRSGGAASSAAAAAAASAAASRVRRGEKGVVHTLVLGRVARGQVVRRRPTESASKVSGGVTAEVRLYTVRRRALKCTGVGVRSASFGGCRKRERSGSLFRNDELTRPRVSSLSPLKL